MAHYSHRLAKDIQHKQIFMFQNDSTTTAQKITLKPATKLE